MVHKKGIQLSGIFIYTALSLLFIITFYPFWNIFVLSLNDATDSLRGGLMLWPRVFSIDSYKAVLSDTALLSSLKVTLLRTAVGVPMNLLAVTTLAYALSQRDLIGRRQINLLFVFTMYFSGGLIPTYMIVKWLGLIDNFLVYLLPGLYNVYWMILVRTYMEGLPYSMIESARIDGANDIQIFAKVVLPSCAPVVATIGLFSAIYHWNAWYDSYIYTNKPVLETDGRRVQALAGIEREHPNDGHNGNDHSHHSGLSVCAKVFYQGDDAWFCKRVDKAGQYQMKIYYLTADERWIYCSVNGGSGQRIQIPVTSGSFNNVRTATVEITLQRENNSLKFYHSDWAPDIDQIAIKYIGN